VPTIDDRRHSWWARREERAFAHPAKVNAIIASEAKQPILPLRGEMDCCAALTPTAAPVIEDR